jgi:aryl-alcohol dehydrogenase-like predicted oxidoreductase
MALRRLALGTVQFGVPYGIANAVGVPSDGEIASILRLAKTAGLDTLDTAVTYGTSESRLGATGVAGWKVITKLPPLADDVVDVEAWIDGHVETSLRRLRIASVYGVLLHRPSDLLKPHGTRILRAIEKQRDHGRLSKWGVSIYDPSELDVLQAFRFGLVQAPFSVLDRRVVETGWLDRLRSAGVEVHARSVFLQGLLLMSAGARPAFARQYQPIWSWWDRCVEAHSANAASVALRFALSEGFERVVIGVDTSEHLLQHVSAVEAGALSLPSPPAAPLELVEPSRWPRV